MPKPGWYLDPADPNVARWHDGTDWTEHSIVTAEWHGTTPPPPPETFEIDLSVPPGTPPVVVLPTSAPEPDLLPRLPLSVRTADRLRTIPWWVRATVPPVAAFALVAGIGHLADGDAPERTATAGTVAPADTVAPPPTAAAERTTPDSTAADTSPTTATTALDPGSSRPSTASTPTAPRRSRTGRPAAAPPAPPPTSPPTSATTTPTTPTTASSTTSTTAGPTMPTVPRRPGERDEPFYATCADAAAADDVPLVKGLPGYRPALDPDGDGFACERDERSA
jgi:hypothetical protein